MPDRGNGRIGYDLFIALDLLGLDGGGDGELAAPTFLTLLFLPVMYAARFR